MAAESVSVSRPRGSQQSCQCPLPLGVAPGPGFTELKALMVAGFTSPGKTHTLSQNLLLYALESEHRDRSAWPRGGVASVECLSEYGDQFLSLPSARTLLPTPDLGTGPWIYYEAARLGPDTGCPWHKGPEAPRGRAVCVCVCECENRTWPLCGSLADRLSVLPCVCT